MNYKELVFNNPEYNFLKENEHLGNNIMLLTLSGSVSYGTNIASSDTDIRGIALERPNELLQLVMEHPEENNRENLIEIVSWKL